MSVTRSLLAALAITIVVATGVGACMRHHAPLCGATVVDLYMTC